MIRRKKIVSRDTASFFFHLLLPTTVKNKLPSEDQSTFSHKTAAEISLDASMQHQEQSGNQNDELILMAIHRQEQQQKVKYKTLSQEIEETLHVIKINPKNALGYLKTAELYSCQGRQYMALSMLNKGMNTVPSSSTDQHLLRQQHDIIQSKIDRRIDYIEQCPYEIICNIANQVNRVCFPGDKLEFIKVSHTWRQKLVSYAPLWKNLSIGDDTLCEINHRLLALFFVTKHTEKLFISGSPNTSIKTLRTYPFPSLKKLEIDIKSLYPIEATRLLESAFPLVAGTVTELGIDAPTSTCIALYQILFALPQLKSVNIRVYALSDPELWARNSTRYLHYNQPKFLSQPLIPESIILLTRLEIGTSVYVPMTVLHSFLRASINLRYLALQCFRHDVDILAIIDTNCPYLADIRLCVKKRQTTAIYDHIDKDNSTIPNLFQSDPSTACQVVPKGGLRSLELVGVQSALPLTFRLEKSKDTLRSMSLMMSEDSVYSREMHWRPLSGFTLNALAYLHICNGRTSFYQHLPTILRHCPALEMLRLQNTPGQLDHNYRLDDAIWNNMALALTELPKLTTVELNNIELRSKEGVKRFLETMQQEAYIYDGERIWNQQQEGYSRQDNNNSTTRNDGTGNGVQCLRLINCQYLTMPMLRIVARIRSLRKIVIAYVMEDLDVREFIELVNNTLPKLQHLEFSHVSITEETAHTIINSWKNNIQKLVLNEDCLYFCQKDIIRVTLKKYPDIYKCIYMY